MQPRSKMFYILTVRQLSSFLRKKSVIDCNFSGLKIEDLRCAPNVFDLMDDNEEDDDEEVEDVDVYVSFEIQDSWTLVRQGDCFVIYSDSSKKAGL